MDANSIPLIGSLIERLRSRADHDLVKAATASRGDVSRVEGYVQLDQCISRLVNMDAGKGSLGRPLRAARGTRDALLKHKAAFASAFGQGGSEAMRLTYVQAVAALWYTVSMMCAQCVRLDKNPSTGTYLMQVDPAGVETLSNSTPVSRLEQFVEASAKYGFAQNVAENAPIVEREALFCESNGAIATVVGGAAALLAIVYIARDLAEFFYRLRGSMSKWLDMQAKFLDMNAAQLQPGAADVRARQESYAARFRALADRLRIEAADAERSVGKSSVPAAAPPPSYGAGQLV